MVTRREAALDHYANSSQRPVAVDVQTQPTHVRRGKPVALPIPRVVPRRGLGRNYDITPDGQAIRRRHHTCRRVSGFQLVGWRSNIKRRAYLVRGAEGREFRRSSRPTLRRIIPGSRLALNPGARLGPYEILSSLGAGGMGEVYRARDTKLNRDVAIKVLPDRSRATPTGSRGSRAKRRRSRR